MRVYELTCVICSKPFTCKMSNGRYCGDECRRQAKNALFRERYIRSAGRDLTCGICGNMFTAHTAWVRYCGPECARVAKNRKAAAVKLRKRPQMPPEAVSSVVCPKSRHQGRASAPATPERIVRGPCIIPLGELGTVTGRIVGRPMDYLGELCVQVVLTHQLDREPDWWPIGCVQVVEDEWA